MGPHRLLVWACAVLLSVSLVVGDLPSCYRARCTHCNVVFIAQMCPNICASCYGGDPLHVPTGPRIRAGTNSHKTAQPAGNNPTAQAYGPRIHGQPTANAGPVHHSLSSQTSPHHGIFAASSTGAALNHESQTPHQIRAPVAQSLPSLENLQQQQQPQQQRQLSEISANTGTNAPPQAPQLPQYQPASNQATAQNQATAYGSSYAPAPSPQTQYAASSQGNGNQGQGSAPTLLNPNTNNGFGGQAAFGQPQFQPQPFFGQQQQQPQAITFFGQQQQQQPLTQQSLGIGQQQQLQPFAQLQSNGQLGQGAGAAPGAMASPFANPFQPFLQQSYAAQQQQPQPFFQPFTLAPLATPSPVLITPAPQNSGFQGIPPQLNQAPQQLVPTAQPQQQPQLLSNGAAPQQTQVHQSQQQLQNGAYRISSNAQPQSLPNTQYSYGPVNNLGQPQQHAQQAQPQIELINEAQRPRQIYNNNAAGQHAQPQLQQQQQPQKVIPSTAAPGKPTNNKYAGGVSTSGMSAAANSIDQGSTFVSKNAYEEKNGNAFAQPSTCPKQPNWEPCISKEIANERFRNCCQRLGEGCSQLCSYDQTLTVLQLAVLTGRCPIAKVADMMICASGYEDATTCCQAHNVFEMGYEHCRPYCNPAAGLPNDGMIAEKYRCLGKLSQIQRCFYISQRP